MAHWFFIEKFVNPTEKRAVILKLECAPELPVGLVSIQIVRLYLQSF